MSACQGCGAELPPQDYQGRPRKWCSERCRKGQYAGTCVDCGAPTNGYDGPGLAGTRCRPCQLRYQHEARLWTPQTIVAAIQKYAGEFGVAPTAADFDRPDQVADYPPVTAVQRECGSWNAALRLAGLEPNREFNRPCASDPTVPQRAAAMYHAGYTLTEVGAAFGVSGTRVKQWLQSLGVPRRTAHESQALREARERVAA